MTRRLLALVSVVSLTILSACGGGSPAAPTPPKPVNGVLAISVLSAWGTNDVNGIKLHVTVRYLETAGGSTSLTKVDFTMKQNGASGKTYENTESHTIGYPTSVDVTATYTDSAGAVKTANASGPFLAIPG